MERPDNSMRFVGLDIGSTTTRLMAARAAFVRNCITGRNELGSIELMVQPDPIFTPFLGDTLDVAAIASQFDLWMAEANLSSTQVAAGGALITGLAAKANNTRELTAAIKSRFPKLLVVTADDPSLESWLAFMGNTLGLSRASPQIPFINLDIGGGTTNIAWGRNGEVERCGCYYIGARHVQVVPGTYQIRQLSPFGRILLAAIGVPAEIGDDLSAVDRERLMNYQVDLLDKIISGAALNSVESKFCQTPFVPRHSGTASSPIVTLSGGVGELAYHSAAKRPLPTTTAFGDLGIDLAIALSKSERFCRHLNSYHPAGMGRATVSGLTLHATEVAGATLYLPHPELLPLTDLPIIGRFSDETSDEELNQLVELAGRGERGGALRVDIASPTTTVIKELGERLANALIRLENDRPCVLLVERNVGNTLGQYATRWGKLRNKLIVVDEIADRPAQFVSLGALANGIVPVSLHGLGASWGATERANSPSEPRP